MNSDLFVQSAPARRLPIFDHIDPMRFISMHAAMSVLSPHLKELIEAGETRQTTGADETQITVSAAPRLGPAARLYATRRADRNAADDLVVLFGPGTGQLDALFIGPQIGRWRVAVLSALALQKMGALPFRPMCLFGTGGQAEMHVHALTALKPSEIRVVGRDSDRTALFCSRMAEESGQRLRPLTDRRAALDGCSAVVTATSSDQPLFDAVDLGLDVALAHIGPKHAQASELPVGVYETASVLLTDFPAELDSRFPDSLLHKAGRQKDEVRTLGDAHPLPLTGRRIYVSLGLPGAEVVLARTLLDRLRRHCCSVPTLT